MKHKQEGILLAAVLCCAVFLVACDPLGLLIGLGVAVGLSEGKPDTRFEPGTTGIVTCDVFSMLKSLPEHPPVPEPIWLVKALKGSRDAPFPDGSNPAAVLVFCNRDPRLGQGPLGTMPPGTLIWPCWAWTIPGNLVYAKWRREYLNDEGTEWNLIKNNPNDYPELPYPTRLYAVEDKVSATLELSWGGALPEGYFGSVPSVPPQGKKYCVELGVFQ